MNAPVSSQVLTLRQIRRRRAFKLAKWVALGAGLPAALALLYYGALNTRQFESSCSFTVQGTDAAPAFGLEMLIGFMPGGAGQRDEMLIDRYLQSPAMLQTLVKDHGFIEHYSDESVDYLSRLPSDASSDEQLEYMRDQIDSEWDASSGILTLHVRAFSAEAAQRFNQAMLDSAEQVVNDMMARARSDRLDLARSEVSNMEKRFTDARAELLRIQREGNELSPVESATALYEVRAELEGKLIEARAELAAARATLQAGAPMISEKKIAVAALKKEVDAINERLAGGDSGLHESIAKFEPAALEKEFAQNALASALKSLELARIDISRQHRYLVTVSPPTDPDRATYPVIWSEVLTVLLVSLSILAISALFVASVREHANL